MAKCHGLAGQSQLRGYPSATISRKVSARGLTTKPCYDTVKSHVNVVVADTASANPDANFWEHIAAKTLEELPEVQSYFKNAYSDFQIPYVAKGKDRHYKPDFICRCRKMSEL